MPDGTIQGALRGISGAQAAQRLAAEGPNELPTAGPRNLRQQAWAVLRVPMLLLLVAAGVINFALSEPLDGVILMLSDVAVVVTAGFVGVAWFEVYKALRR